MTRSCHRIDAALAGSCGAGHTGDKCPSTGAKNASRRWGAGCQRDTLEDMSLLSILLVVAVVSIALYVLAALIYPERF